VGPIRQARDAFSDIYERNVWGKGSGVGSEVAHTRDYVATLQAFMRQHGVQSVIDFGCGDWQFSQHMDWSGVRYQGFDVVPELIAANSAAFAAPNVSFHLVDDGVALPAVDLLICKDVLQHLPVHQVRRYLAVFKQLSKHALITNDVWPDANLNIDIEPGQCRPLRLDLPPFSERFDVLLTWEVNAYGSSSTKQTCHLRGSGGVRPQHIVLEDRPEPIDIVDKAKRSLGQRVRDAIKDTPLAPFARRLKALLRP
jgi:SAM-dependent methyltransferase